MLWSNYYILLIDIYRIPFLIYYSSVFAESRRPSRPTRLQVEPFARELIVRWIPATESVLVRGYKLGYGTISPDESWVDIGPNERIRVLTNLSK